MKKDEIINYNTAAEFLGIKIGTLYSMVSRKEIPHIRLSPRLVSFSKQVLSDWLSQRHINGDSMSNANSGRNHD
ncbi:MAG: helix-turn-helix domain-containing protein [Bdellovibrionaceae bacterium]|nr:helix-turn-helix domain-containing protein [Pseudobdellovibrionaceae bacterium]